jgi:hypothetical protein
MGILRVTHPALVFPVVGQSRDDVLTVVQAGGHHPGSQRTRRNSQFVSRKLTSEKVEKHHTDLITRTPSNF